MNSRDKDAYISRYSSRVSKYGYSPKSLGWGKSGRQEIRYSVLGEEVLAEPGSSVLDVGCGFADLYDFLSANNWRGCYTGIDIVPDVLDIARERHADLDLRLVDLEEFASENIKGTFDFVIASGIFNAKLIAEDNTAHIERSVNTMLALSRKAVCVDFMSTNVDFVAPDSWHTDPALAMRMASTLSRRFSLRHDYMPYEFSLIIYKEDAISERNIFSQFKNKHPSMFNINRDCYHGT